MTALAATSDFHPARPRAVVRFGRADADQVFRSAVRHSRHVRFMRMALPAAVAVSFLGAVAFATIAKPLRALSRMPVDIGSLVVSGSKIVMQQPRLAGFTQDNRRYDLTAQAAAQDLGKPDQVELQGIHATLEMQDRSVFETTAQSGHYNSKTEMLTLHHNIVVTSSTGYQALLNEATVDIRGGTIVSNKPVDVKTQGWTVNANRMEISEAGDVMRFERGVTVVVLPENSAPRPTAEVRR
jgi:lipopolysaccharide export system protein LptC